MAISSSDLIFFYSKGPSGNLIGSSASLGGEITDNPITTDKLFDNVTKEQISSGLVDYRCIYLKNNNSYESIKNLNLSITEYLPSKVEFGFEKVSVVTLSGSILNASGDGSVVTYRYKASSPILAGQKVSVINTFPVSYKFSGIVLTATTIPESDIGGQGVYTFTVSSTITDQYFSGGSITQRAIKTLANPVNVTTNPIVNRTTAPENISFLDSSFTYIVETMNPGDFIGIWIKRIILPNITPKDNDGFAINISADGDTIIRTPTPTPTPTLTSTPTLTPTITPTLTETPPNWTFPPTPTPTQTLSPTPTMTIGPTATVSEFITLTSHPSGDPETCEQIDVQDIYTWCTIYENDSITFQRYTGSNNSPAVFNIYVRVNGGTTSQVASLTAVDGLKNDPTNPSGNLGRPFNLSISFECPGQSATNLVLQGRFQKNLTNGTYNSTFDITCA